MQTAVFIRMFIAAGVLTLAGQTGAAAGEHSLTAGYAFGQVNIDHTRMADGDQDGMNLKYRYEFNDSWGAVGSFTFAGATSDNNAVEWSYTSYMAGPAWRFNRYVSVYYLLGLAHADTDVTYEGRRQGMKKNALASALGVQVNPWKNLVLDAGVEYAGFSSYPLRGTEAESVIFALGAGYRF